MLRYTDRRNAIMAQLLNDPVLNRLHHAAIDRAEARLAELKQTEGLSSAGGRSGQSFRRAHHPDHRQTAPGP